MIRLLLSVCTVVCAGFASWPTSASDRVTVFAAASLSEVLTEAAERFQADTGVEVVLSAAGSSAIARQVSLGAPADIVVLASQDWMDWLHGTGVTDVETEVTIARNRLALISGEIKDTTGPPKTFSIEGRLAMALVDAVPAGQYGKAALEHLGLWEQLKANVVQTDNVRAALALVASRAVPMGVVYASDALVEPRVHLVDLFPEDSHPPIVYPAVATRGASVNARAFLDLLRSSAGQTIFMDRGFLPAQGTP